MRRWKSAAASWSLATCLGLLDSKHMFVHSRRSNVSPHGCQEIAAAATTTKASRMEIQTAEQAIEFGCCPSRHLLRAGNVKLPVQVLEEVVPSPFTALSSGHVLLQQLMADTIPGNIELFGHILHVQAVLRDSGDEGWHAPAGTCEGAVSMSSGLGCFIRRAACQVLYHVAEMYALLLSEGSPAQSCTNFCLASQQSAACETAGWQPTFSETQCRPHDFLEAA